MTNLQNFCSETEVLVFFVVVVLAACVGVGYIIHISQILAARTRTPEVIEAA